MSLPELVRLSAEKIFSRYCEERTPVCSCDQGRLSFRIQDDHITLFAEQPATPVDRQGTTSPLARFCFSHELGQWTLHYPDDEQRWRFYLNVGPSLDLSKLLKHLDADPLNVFWN